MGQHTRQGTASALVFEAPLEVFEQFWPFSQATHGLRLARIKLTLWTYEESVVTYEALAWHLEQTVFVAITVRRGQEYLTSVTVSTVVVGGVAVEAVLMLGSTEDTVMEVELAVLLTAVVFGQTNVVCVT